VVVEFRARRSPAIPVLGDVGKSTAAISSTVRRYVDMETPAALRNVACMYAIRDPDELSRLDELAELPR
jgi:hypothetical protein